MAHMRRTALLKCAKGSGHRLLQSNLQHLRPFPFRNTLGPYRTMSSAPAPKAWDEPGPAAYDFRSDTITTPSRCMLTAIESTTLFDDVYLEDTTTTALESSIAELTSQEAGLLVLSGTMGNQISIRCLLTQPPHSVLCDSRAHIIRSEAGGVASLSGAMLTGVVPSNGLYLTLEDVKDKVVLGDDIHSCPTRVISLENTLAGMIMPVVEVQRISSFARSNNIKMHLDGARLWEAASAGAGSISEYCQYFDSVSLCFSKSLGAPMGSIIVGSSAFVKHARWIRKSIGGGIRMSGIVAAAARAAIDDVFGKGGTGEGGRLARTHAVASALGDRWVSKGGRLRWPVETNMVWLDLKSLGKTQEQFDRAGQAHGLKSTGERLVVHYQICDDAVSRLHLVMDEMLSAK